MRALQSSDSSSVVHVDVKPIVKWAGGKTRLLGELLTRVPTTMRAYAEPFSGGAALFFAVASERAGVAKGRRTFEKAFLADQNEDLIACYRATRDEVDALVEALGKYHYDKKLFYETRDLDPRSMSDVERGARFIFLNRTCFNGLWRVNSRGQFNVPFGRYTNPRILDEKGLRAASVLLQGVDLRVADFTAVTALLGAGDFVYFDPPYVPASKTADFTAYSSIGFGDKDQQRLVDEFRALKKKGVLALLSNADTPGTRELYKEFSTHVVHAPRAINSDSTKRGDTPELLVASWGPQGLFE